MQALAVAVVLALPLIYTEGLPKLQLLTVSAPIGPPPGPPQSARRQQTTPSHSNMFHGIVVAPQTIPASIQRVVEDGSAREAPPCAFCAAGGTGTVAASNSVLNSIGNSMAVAPPPPPPAAHPLRVSQIMEGNLIHRVQPIYPHLAQMGRVQGTVMLRAIISRAGTIENLQVISGHPLLVGAAMDAVRQWRYRPYLLNGEPVAVETQVTVNFSLSGGGS
ncbi:MAG TPA: energy transducer TonB, partial [Terriglobales bacterium]|nr:energy transducer TonB [Terriglobales bacterium]